MFDTNHCSRNCGFFVWKVETDETEKKFYFCSEFPEIF